MQKSAFQYLINTHTHTKFTTALRKESFTSKQNKHNVKYNIVEGTKF